METTSFIHDVLRKRDKSVNWPYMSSILIVNMNIPLFEEIFGQLDYEWLLEVTKNRKCKEIKPCVIRYIDGTNLSLNSEYRKRDFYISMLMVDDNIDTIKSLYGTRARYYYVMGEMKRARFHFWRSKFNWKTLLYYITSYNKVLSKWIVRKFTVFG